MSGAGAATCLGGVRQLDASAAPASAFGSRAGPGSSTVATNTVSIVVTGGVGPFTYAWTRQTADQGMSISDAAAATVSWSKNMTGDANITETWRCLVTDTALGQTDTVDVAANLISSSGA